MDNNTSYENKLTDAFNEVTEIGLNSSAEILSKLLNHEVSFDTVKLDQEKIAGLESFGEDPGLAVELDISGAVQGKAAVVVQSVYIKEIINILMSVDSDGAEESGELDEIAIGTFKELVGQMAQAYAEALTNFLGSDVTIAAGQADEISEQCEEVADFIGSDPGDECVCLVNGFSVKDCLDGEFVIVINHDTFDNTVKSVVVDEDEDDDEDEYEDDEEEDMTDEEPGGLNIPRGIDMGTASGSSRKYNRSRGVMKNGGGINVQNASFPSFAGVPNGSGIPLLNGNIDLLMDVPLNVTIEIGKTRKKMREIMEFAQGTIIDLEKQAGAPVDVVVNGQLIARGDVVVIDDNFGVRITEIIGNANFADKK